MSLRRSTRILAAIELAIERDAELLDRAAGLAGMNIRVHFDKQTGYPSRATIDASFEHYIVTRPLENFTFDAT